MLKSEKDRLAMSTANSEEPEKKMDPAKAEDPPDGATASAGAGATAAETPVVTTAAPTGTKPKTTF